MIRFLPSASHPRRTLIAIALLVVVFLANAPLRRVALTVLRFPLTSLHAIARGVRLLPRLPLLSRENARLRAQLAERQLESAELRERLRHLQAREDLLKQLPSRQGIIAGIVGRSTLPMVHTVLVDKGTRHGITVGSVILDGSGIVGRVMEAHPSDSLVVLLTDPESRIAALVERSRETGLLVGMGRGQCQLVYLAMNADVQRGDRVVTAGLGGTFPKGLPLGTVARLDHNPQSGTASAWIEPSAQLGRLEDVVCLPVVPEQEIAPSKRSGVR